MINDNTVVEPYPLHPLKRISWSAIFVGALVATGLGFLLNLFGVAIGLTAFTQNSSGAEALAWGGFAGFLIGVIVSMVLAGYAAGYLGRMYCPKRNLGILYGFTTWALALIFSVIITAHLSDYVMSYTNALGYTSVATSTDGDQNPALKVEASAANQNQNNDQNVVKATATAGALAWGAFAVFLTFMIGAIACCIGACWAMTCQRID